MSIEDPLPGYYTEKLPISEQKKTYLFSLWHDGIISLEYNSYYNNIPASGKVGDCLADPDAMESKNDSKTNDWSILIAVLDYDLILNYCFNTEGFW